VARVLELPEQGRAGSWAEQPHASDRLAAGDLVEERFVRAGPCLRRDREVPRPGVEALGEPSTCLRTERLDHLCGRDASSKEAGEQHDELLRRALEYDEHAVP